MPCDSAAAGLVALGALIRDLGSDSTTNVGGHYDALLRYARQYIKSCRDCDMRCHPELKRCGYSSRQPVWYEIRTTSVIASQDQQISIIASRCRNRKRHLDRIAKERHRPENRWSASSPIEQRCGRPTGTCILRDCRWCHIFPDNLRGSPLINQ